MPREVELPELPDCQVCVVLHVTPRQATADSVLRIPGRRQVWGYSCEGHKAYRVGAVTRLVKAP